MILSRMALQVQELEALNARLQTHVLELQHQLDTQRSPSPPKLLKDDARLKQEIERLQGIIQKQSHELLRKHGNSKEPESSRSNRDRYVVYMSYVSCLQAGVFPPGYYMTCRLLTKGSFKVIHFRTLSPKCGAAWMNEFFSG